jgi:hypothetical protein
VAGSDGHIVCLTIFEELTSCCKSKSGYQHI